MKKLIFLLTIVLLGILQVTLLDHFRLFNIRPDLLLICAVIASLTFNLRTALFFSAFAGIFKDLFVGSAFCINTLLFSLWSFLIVELSRQIPLEEISLRMALMLIVTILHNLASGLLMLSLGNSISLGIFLRILLIETVLTALFFPLVSRILKPAYS